MEEKIKFEKELEHEKFRKKMECLFSKDVPDYIKQKKIVIKQEHDIETKFKAVQSLAFFFDTSVFEVSEIEKEDFSVDHFTSYGAYRHGVKGSIPDKILKNILEMHMLETIFNLDSIIEDMKTVIAEEINKEKHTKFQENFERLSQLRVRFMNVIGFKENIDTYYTVLEDQTKFLVKELTEQMYPLGGKRIKEEEEASKLEESDGGHSMEEYLEKLTEQQKQEQEIFHLKQSDDEEFEYKQSTEPSIEIYIEIDKYSEEAVRKMLHPIDYILFEFYFFRFRSVFEGYISLNSPINDIPINLLNVERQNLLKFRNLFRDEMEEKIKLRMFLEEFVEELAEIKRERDLQKLLNKEGKVLINNVIYDTDYMEYDSLGPGVGPTFEEYTVRKQSESDFDIKTFGIQTFVINQTKEQYLDKILKEDIRKILDCMSENRIEKGINSTEEKFPFNLVPRLCEWTSDEFQPSKKFLEYAKEWESNCLIFDYKAGTSFFLDKYDLRYSNLYGEPFDNEVFAVESEKLYIRKFFFEYVERKSYANGEKGDSGSLEDNALLLDYSNSYIQLYDEYLKENYAVNGLFLEQLDNFGRVRRGNVKTNGGVERNELRKQYGFPLWTNERYYGYQGAITNTTIFDRKDFKLIQKFLRSKILDYKENYKSGYREYEKYNTLYEKEYTSQTKAVFREKYSLFLVGLPLAGSIIEKKIAISEYQYLIFIIYRFLIERDKAEITDAVLLGREQLYSDNRLLLGDPSELRGNEIKASYFETGKSYYDPNTFLYGDLEFQLVEFEKKLRLLGKESLLSQDVIMDSLLNVSFKNPFKLK